MLRGQLMQCGEYAVIKRDNGYWHHIDPAKGWEGPYKWVFTGPVEKIPIFAPGVVKWVTHFGHLPDLPPRASLA